MAVALALTVAAAALRSPSRECLALPTQSPTTLTLRAAAVAEQVTHRVTVVAAVAVLVVDKVVAALPAATWVLRALPAVHTLDWVVEVAAFFPALAAQARVRAMPTTLKVAAQVAAVVTTVSRALTVAQAGLLETTAAAPKNVTLVLVALAGRLQVAPSGMVTSAGLAALPFKNLRPTRS